MELKLVIEIEEGSKPIIKDFSRALMALGNTTTITNPAGTVVGKIQKFMQPTPAEDEYVKQEMETIETEAPKKEESVPAAAVPSLTLEQLRAGCAEMSRLGKGAELRRLIREVYKIPKLDDLDPKNYEGFANDLRELGVRI